MNKNSTQLDPESSGSSSASSAESSTTVQDSKSLRNKSGNKNAETKKKKRKKHLSICLTNCRYEIIRKVAQKFGIKEVHESDNWNFYWTDLSISIERCKDMKRFQRINHFPGMLEICRKDLLARNLNRMLKIFNKDYNFFPKTWCLPADLGDALNYSRLRKNKTFILKPDAGSQGRGIFITKSLKDIKPTERMICQVYISRPFLIDGYKFDLRVYTLLTSCDPLRIYVYNEGLVRFATSPYNEPAGINTSNVFMHLTNYAVNKHSRSYNLDDEAGSKRKLSWFNTYMRALGHDTTRLWSKIDDVIIKTIFSALPILKHSYHACFPNHDLVPACCELLGMDILLDRHLQPYLLEVNHSPSFHTDTVLDTEVKENLITDMFSMLNLEQCDKRKIIKEDRKRIQDRLLRGHVKENETPAPNKKLFMDYYRHEMANRGGYRLIYPDTKTEHLYTKYLRQGQSSVYTDTASSNARQQAAAALRDEIKTNEQSKKMAQITSRPKTTPDHSAAQTPKPTKTCSVSLKSINTICSFEPQMIVEAEEKERLVMLAHRDFLVKSYGLADHIYFLLKKNGVLRPADEKKYNQQKNAMNSYTHEPAKKSGDKKNKPTIQNCLDFNSADNEPIKCDLAKLYSRPEVPNSWFGTNKNQLIRTFSNGLKIQTNQNREDRKLKK